jgi:succinate-semialdehyde dehydrogenase/glutarate-semialdehyde dehydrogenase
VFSPGRLPAGVFTTLLVDKAHAEAVIRHPVVGRSRFRQRAGRAGGCGRPAGSVLKKTVLELGGSGPVHRAGRRRRSAGGQGGGRGPVHQLRPELIAAKRFIVEDPAYAEFVEAMAPRCGT